MHWTLTMLEACQRRINRGGEDFAGLRRLLRLKDYLVRRTVRP